MSIKKVICLASGLLLMLPMMVYADEVNGADTAWVLTSTALVLFMTLPGLALFYSGLVRAKNVLSVLMQCFAIACHGIYYMDGHCLWSGIWRWWVSKQVCWWWQDFDVWHRSGQC